MLKGLRKRESYEELINELGEDPIKKYPDRRASQIENSNFMSQLASGFQEVIEQNNRVLKEKTKELLLQDIASSSGSNHTHGSMKLSSSALDAPSDAASFKSLGSMGLNAMMAASSHRPTFLPKRSAQQFNIGSQNNSPRSAHSAHSETSEQKEFRRIVFGPDIDPEALYQSLQAQQEHEAEQQRQQQKRANIITEFRHIQQGVNTTINTMVHTQPDVNMLTLKDIEEENPFEGVFKGEPRVDPGASSSSQVPVKKMVEKIEKKEKKEKK